MATFAEHHDTIRDCARANIYKVAKARGIASLLTDERVEEMEHGIYLRLLKSGTVERYDPNNATGASITTYIFGQTRYMAMHELEDFVERHNQETVSIDEEIQAKRTRIQLIAGETPPEDPYVTKALQYCLAKLQTDYPPTTSRDFAWLFAQLAESAQDGVELSLREIADRKGISYQAVSNQIKALRELEPVRQFLAVLRGDRYRAHEPLATRVDPNYTLA